MIYRPEIDGLRAIAVLAVILNHAGVTQLAGGFAGVDVFFVISGFLITHIIYTGAREGTFSFRHFYERRARRILPALFVMILVTMPMIFFVLAPFQLKDYAQSVAATLVYLSNALFFREAGYFAVEAAQKPLLHTWSLAIEEQYYLIFPLAAVLLYRLGGRGVLLVALVLTGLVSFGLMLHQTGVDANAAFYLIQYRAWELMAGSLAAVWVCERRPAPNVALSALGLGLILLGLIVTSDPGNWPAPSTAILVVGTVLALVFTSAQGPVGRVLAHDGPRTIGLMSYSLYLWHWPFLSAVKVWFIGDPPVASLVGAVLLTFLCAWLSWWYVETPFRKADRVPLQGLLAFLASMMLGLGAFGYMGQRTNGYFDVKLTMIPDDYRELVIDRDGQLRAREAFWTPLLTQADQPFDEDAAHRVLILGDSMSEDLLMAVTLRADATPGIAFRRLRLDDVCMSAAAVALTAPHTAAPQTNGCGAEITAFLDTGLMQVADEIVLTAGWQTETVYGGVALVKALRAQNKAVALVGTAAFNDMTSLSMMLSRMQDPVEVFLYRNLRSKFLEVNSALETQITAVEGARYLDKLALFCDHAARRCDMLDGDGRLPIWDASHLTMGGLELFADRLHARGWF